MNSAGREQMLAFAVKRGDIDPAYLGCNRFTPKLMNLRECLENNPYIAGTLSDWVFVNPTTELPELDEAEEVSFLPMEAVSERTGESSIRKMPFSEVVSGYTRFAEGDFLWAKITPCMQNGKSCIARGLIKGVGFGSTEFHVLRPKSDNIIPEYLWMLLSLGRVTTAAQAQFTGTAGQQRVPDAFLRGLPFPKPPKSLQVKYAEEYASSLRIRREKLRQAENALSRIDAIFQKLVGIETLAVNNTIAYGARLGTKGFGRKFGAAYYHPERMGALRAIEGALRADKVRRLGEIVDFIRVTEDLADPEKYIGVENIESNTGELVANSGEPVKGKCFVFRNGDVLYGKLRPYLNKVWSADKDGICSKNFHVLRIKSSTPPIFSEYLATALRSSVVVAQIKHMMTGNTHPRLANDDMFNLLIPVPNSIIQVFIIEEIHQHRRNSRKLREDADKRWVAAINRFETEIIGGE